MKTTDWYLRLVLGLIAGSLVYLAVILRTATQEAAAFYARAPLTNTAGSVAIPAAWRTLTPVSGQTTSTMDTEPINVRIVGYRYKTIRQGNYSYNDREFGMGHSSSTDSKKTVANKLPVCISCD